MSTIQTPLLDKPYKRVKAVAGSIVRESGGWDHGQLVIYMDPRGSISFAIGLPDYVGAFFEGTTEKNDRTGQYKGMVQRTSKNVDKWVVAAASAEEVVAVSRRIMKLYEEEFHKANKAEVILITFEGLAPKIDALGDCVMVDHECQFVYKAGNTRYSSRHDSTDISLAFWRRWKIGKEFFYKDAKGNLRPDSYRSAQSEIPYSDEAWDQLVGVRNTLAHACSVLGKVLDADNEKIAARLRGLDLPMLPAPKP